MDEAHAVVVDAVDNLDKLVVAIARHRDENTSNQTADQLNKHGKAATIILQKHRVVAAQIFALKKVSGDNEYTVGINKISRFIIATHVQTQMESIENVVTSGTVHPVRTWRDEEGEVALEWEGLKADEPDDDSWLECYATRKCCRAFKCWSELNSITFVPEELFIQTREVITMAPQRWRGTPREMPPSGSRTIAPYRQYMPGPQDTSAARSSNEAMASAIRDARLSDDDFAAIIQENEMNLNEAKETINLTIS